MSECWVPALRCFLVQLPAHAYLQKQQVVAAGLGSPLPLWRIPTEFRIPRMGALTLSFKYIVTDLNIEAQKKDTMYDQLEGPETRNVDECALVPGGEVGND